MRKLCIMLAAMVLLSGVGLGASSEKEWYVSDGTQKYGPYTSGQVREFYRTGRLTKKSYLWKKGMKEWRQLRYIEEFDGLALVKPELENDVYVEDTPSKENVSEGPKYAIQRLLQAKGIYDMAPALTNESAGMMGIMLSGLYYAVVGLAKSMSQGFDQMAKEMGAKPTQQPKETPQMAEFKREKAQFDKLMKKYKIDMKAGKMDETFIKKNGRKFLTEVGLFLERTSTKKTTGTSEDRYIKMVKEMDKMTFTALEPGRVKIVHRDYPKEPLEARYEDGAWRLHLPIDDSVLKKKGKK